MRLLFVMVLFIITHTRLCNAADLSPTPTAAAAMNEQQGVVEEVNTTNEKSTPAPKNVYKWVDDQGLTHYGDKPPSEDMTPIDLPYIQILDDSNINQVGESVPDATSSPVPVAGSSNYRLSISSPKNNETITRNQDGTVVITLSLNTPLLENHYILMKVDDNEISADNAGTVTIPLNRGIHSVQAFIKDDSQNELASSDTVTFTVASSNQQYNESVIVRATAVPRLETSPLPATAIPTSAPTVAPTPAPKPTKEPKVTPKPKPYVSG
jgi:Domain of unknown function (DUF4124)